MSVTEHERHQIFSWYDEAMGSERAAIMMNLLPPVGWGDVATRADLVRLGTELRGEMAETRGELRGEIAALRAELHGEIAALRGELHGEVAALRGELRGEIKAGNADLLRTLFFSMVASNATLVGLVLAAVKLA